MGKQFKNEVVNQRDLRNGVVSCHKAGIGCFGRLIGGGRSRGIFCSSRSTGFVFFDQFHGRFSLWVLLGSFLVSGLRSHVFLCAFVFLLT